MSNSRDFGIIGYLTPSAADETYTDEAGDTQDSVAFTGGWVEVGLGGREQQPR